VWHIGRMLSLRPQADLLQTTMVCCLMVSSPVIHIIHMDYYLFTDPGGTEG